MSAPLPNGSFREPDASVNPAPDNTVRLLVILAVAAVFSVLVCGGALFLGLYATLSAPNWAGQPDLLDTSADQTKFNELVSAGRYAEAVAAAEKLVDEHPNDAVVHNALAWVLATCPDDAVRDGKRAIKHATFACEYSDWQNPAIIDTLAAAYAEAGDFPQAVRWQEEACRLSADTPLAADMQRRLAIYRSEQPFREGVPPARAAATDPAKPLGDQAPAEDNAQEPGAAASCGSDSGAVPHENIAWVKRDQPGPKVLLNSDASIVAPLIFAYVPGQ